MARLASEVTDVDLGRLKVGWDAGNGAAGEAMALLTKQLGGKHVILNEAIDGNFPAHHPDPTVPKNLEQLQETVAKREAATSASRSTATATASARSMARAASCSATSCCRSWRATCSRTSRAASSSPT